MVFNILLFPDFETLDVFGPVEIFGKLENTTIRYFSEKGGSISNLDGVRIETQPVSKITDLDVLFIPGGMGARTEVNNTELLKQIKSISEQSLFVLTVCTGSAILAKTGLLDHKKATSNKRSFEWVKSCSDKVLWVNEARWVVDSNYYTSSGVSAGIDMALGFVADQFGVEEARKIAFRIEYRWLEDKDADEFCNQQQ